MRHLIPCDTSVDAEQTANMYLQYVWKLHRLPTNIRSECGTQFTSKFPKSLCQQLKIEARISSAYHPETDDRTERLNTIMDQYLRCYISYEQEDGTRWLPMAEFAANNHESATTEATPFFAKHGFHQRFDNGLAPTDWSPHSLDAQQFTNTIANIHDYLRTQIQTIKTGMKKARTSTVPLLPLSRWATRSSSPQRT